jgi:transcriptional regulator with XRE-family HTH domain
MVDRISKLIKVKKLSASRFADIVGVPRSTISHILSGRNNPSLDFIQKVLSSFPEIRVAWLLRGEEPMFISSNNLFSGMEDPLNPPASGQPAGDKASSKATPAQVRTENKEYPQPSPRTSAGPEAPAGEPIPEEQRLPGDKPPQPAPASRKAGEGDRVAGATVPPFPPLPGRKAVKVVFFYEDGTFTEYHPAGQ